jgi:4-alpha-glucanotransferase
MVGTHDNEPIKMWADKTINTEVGYQHAKNLADDLYYKCCSHDEFVQCLNTDAAFLAKIKLVELFACCSQNVQIFFTDYFNIYNVYNRPGTSGEQNWSLRLPDNYKELHAIDLAKILRLAIIARGNDFSQNYTKLLEKLDGQ